MIRKLHNFLCGHLSDKELTLLATGDLPAHRHARMDQHLAACAMCRVRLGRFEDVFLQVTAYHAERAERDKLHSRERRARLVMQLNQMPDDLHGREVVRPEHTRKHDGALLPMNPILLTGLFLAFASVTCIFVWMQQTRPDITSNALLVRAEAWDAVAARNATPGVIRQTVRITTRKRTVNHTIYRDAQGRRRLRQKQLADEEDELRWQLARADVVWDAPLSATSYQNWHDRQQVRQDQIERSTGHLLVLTTTTPNGPVAAQSLSVRDTDFHPVRRTVSFRDSETVEIAELDYSLLPWTPATSSLFQPKEELRAAGLKSPEPTLVPLPPPRLTEEQLDEVELSTRLALNRLHADMGEQIEVTRGPHGIEVSGITDTEERKHELEAELHMLPHVTASISSIEELKANPSQPGDLSSVKVIEVQTQATPLEAYYLAHGRSVASVANLAQRLFDTAFAINLESRAIDDLQRRFSHDEEISMVASATLADLLFTHKHKLLTALEDEEQLLAAAQVEAASSRQSVSTSGIDLPLAALSERNLALTRELALGKGGSGRSAETIASELVGSINELNLRAHEIQVAPQNFTKLDKRK